MSDSRREPLDDTAFDERTECALASRGVEVVRVVSTDLFGRQRAKQFPLTMWRRLADGLGYSKVANAEDLLGVPVDAASFPDLAGHPDLHVVPEPGRVLTPPWEPDLAWVLASLEENGAPSALCPRAQLRIAADRLAESTGLTARAAGEPEFYLFREGAGRAVPYSESGVSYSIDRVADPDGIVGAIHRQLAGFAIGVTAVNREYSPGQFEINLDHDEVLRAADSVFVMKSAIKELATAHGLLATFMPKPRPDFEGSGLHVHMSLWDRDGSNAFAAEGGALSELGLQAIGGLQQHAAALMAFAAPTINSYKRLSGAGLSPRSSNWAYDNRLTFVRIPPERGSATRVELRIGDAAASPHLLMAAMMHAMRDGIVRGLNPSADGAALPASLAESLRALQSDPVMVEAFGSELVGIYAAIKQREVEASAAHVSDWEWDIYRSQV